MGNDGGLRRIRVVHAVVDDVQIVAVLRGSSVTVLTNLAGRLNEVGRGAWDNDRFQPRAWLGRDEEHHAMVVGAIQEALAAAREPSGDVRANAAHPDK